MSKHKSNQPKSISNRRAKFDYELEDSLVAGLLLSGPEVKNLRMRHGHLRGAYVTVKNDELYLINATITGSGGVPIPEDEQTRARKLLVNKKEIQALLAAKQDGRTIVPLEILINGRFIKLRLAAGKGKKRYDKRQALKAKDDARRAAMALKSAR